MVAKGNVLDRNCELGLCKAILISKLWKAAGSVEVTDICFQRQNSMDGSTRENWNQWMAIHFKTEKKQQPYAFEESYKS